MLKKDESYEYEKNVWRITDSPRYGWNYICGSNICYNSSSASTIKQLIIYGVIGIIFFVASIGLIRTTKDES